MKTILFSAIAMALFFGLYCLTLRRSNLFRLRRFYLVGTLIVAMIIPFVSIETKAPQAARMSAYVQQIQMSEEVIVPQIEVQEASIEPVQAVTPSPAEPVAVAPSWNWKDALQTVYLVGCAFAFILLIVKLIKTFSYYRRSSISDELSSREMRVRVLAEPDGNLPFSFLRSMFVNPEVFTDGELQQVLRHERTHIRQRHTWDLLFLEVLKVLQWFNPVIYLYAKELSCVHEYLADEQVLAQGASRRDYLELLYKQLCVGKFMPVGNSFRHLLTKKRILMMSQPVKRRMSAWWLLALIPVVCGLLMVNCHPKTEEVADELVEEVVEEPEDPVIYNPVGNAPDVMPEFPGGIQQYVDNLYDSMRYPEVAKKYKLRGLFTIRFIVEKDGRVRHVEFDTASVIWDPVCGKEECVVATIPFNGGKKNDGIEIGRFYLGDDANVDKESRNEIIRQLFDASLAEITRAFRAAPVCKPAMKDGQPVRCWLWLPVAFSAGENPTAKVTVSDPRASENYTSVDLVESDPQSGPHFRRIEIDTIPYKGFVVRD
jgi:beta-lactamase regulating signal transducer with metallopeptidase domain